MPSTCMHAASLRLSAQLLKNEPSHPCCECPLVVLLQQAIACRTLIEHRILAQITWRPWRPVRRRGLCLQPALRSSVSLSTSLRTLYVACCGQSAAEDVGTSYKHAPVCTACEVSGQSRRPRFTSFQHVVLWEPSARKVRASCLPAWLVTTCTRTHAFARPKTNAKRSTDLPGGGTLGSAAACCVVPSKLGTLLALITEPSCVGAAFCTNLQSASNCHVASRSDRAGRPRQPWGLPYQTPALMASSMSRSPASCGASPCRRPTSRRCATRRGRSW